MVSAHAAGPREGALQVCASTGSPVVGAGRAALGRRGLPDGRRDHSPIEVGPLPAGAHEFPRPLGDHGPRGRPASAAQPSEPVFTCSYTQADKFFPKAVARAQAVLRQAGEDVSRLEGYTWHCTGHRFASRLVMAGVDLRTIQQLGGWRALTMVQRYSHLAPTHLRDAVERLVTPVQLRENFDCVLASRAGVS